MELKKSTIKHITYILLSFLGSFVLIAHGIILDFDLNALSRITYQGVILSTLTLYAIMVIYEKVHEYDDAEQRSKSDK